MHSISFKQRPTITVEAKIPSQEPRIYLFDPKYKLDGEGAVKTEETDKTGSNVDEREVTGKPKIDIDKMHAYRDAIRGEW